MDQPGFNGAKAGVMLVDPRTQGQQQGELDLFGVGDATPGTPSPDTTRRMEAVNATNRRFGRGTVTAASARHRRSNGEHAGK